MNAQHIARLAEIEGPLPAVLVHRPTMRVIDGMHRYLAALSNGQKTIEVEFFDGTTEEAYLRAVQANSVHGLPLSPAERKAAAARIIASLPHMSDRAIAKAAGLGAKAVATIRRRMDETPQLNARVGQDGKVRPLNSAEARYRVAELLAERPGASLRELARLACVSPATVSDVRRRLASGEPPAPERSGVRNQADKGPSTGRPAAVHPQPAGRKPHRRMRLVAQDPGVVLDKLSRDPSLRHREEGRRLLRLLQQHAIATQEWPSLSTSLSGHSRETVASLAREYAKTWLGFAQELDERLRAGLLASG
ncbi:helix-turn-helix domain-containing protein [Streptomyces iakyrus]|uniref:helix-turn-helix domain-containing protein n=1 Tax=Streptomyces iakyrus TaxID=68219 RepID=UPI0033BE85CF